MKSKRTVTFFMMHKSILLTGALLGLSVSFHCPANPSAKSAPPSPAWFSVHDANQDGYIDRQEYQAFRQQVQTTRTARGRGPRSFFSLLEFDTIDQNADGKIGESEMVSALQERLHQRRRHRRGYQPLR